ncbi:MAG TPA: hypothetical protein VNR86_02140 [Sphingomicrobium sp.]|nr:hypothetical protein [Sphingomicrobium sp.]
MQKIWIVMGLAGVLGACGQARDNQASNQASASAAAPKKERPAYCFFKDSETKEWAASRDKDGNVVIKGKAYREDSRYQAQIGKTDVSGSSATVWPTIAPNMTAYGAPNDWWDVKQTIPNSSNVTEVSVRCGEKTLAELKIPPKG